MRDRVLAITSLVGLCGAAAPALAGSYVYTQLQVPGSYYTGVKGINESGQVVGVLLSFTGGQHEGGFVWQGGTYHTVEIGAALAFDAINGAGNVAGVHQTLSGPDVAFIYRSVDDAIRYPLRRRPGFAGADVRLAGINQSNTLAGDRSDASLGRIGFTFRDGVLAYATVPGGASTVLCGINNAGASYGAMGAMFNLCVNGGRWFSFDHGVVTQLPDLYLSHVASIDEAGRLVGHRALPGRTSYSEGFIYDHGNFDTFRWFGVVDGSPKVADRTDPITNTDVGVLGNYQNFTASNFYQHSFVMREGTFYPLDFPGSDSTYMVATNRLGDFVGFYGLASAGLRRVYAFVAVCPADQRPCTQ